MRKKLVLLVLALAAVAATSAITPASASGCPPPQIQVYCDDVTTICCYKFQPCICPAALHVRGDNSPGAASRPIPGARV